MIGHKYMQNTRRTKAFPSEHANPHDCPQGMTLREYYAGQALPAILARWPSGFPTKVAEDCFAIADAMIGESNKEPS